VGIPKASFKFHNRLTRSMAKHSMRTRLAQLAGDIELPLPWSDLYGLARSLLAVGSLLTLLFTTASDLIFVVDAGASGNRCSGFAGLGLFCLGGNDHLQIKQWVAIAVLVSVVSGWRPRITCLPHAYVAVSLFHNISAPEGGDQIASSVALMLVPICLSDRRRWHWSSYNPPNVMTTTWGQVRIIGAFLGMALIKVQLSWLYLQSGIAKLGQTAWLDGTAMYYWARNGTFGVPMWSRDTVYWLTSQPIFEAGMSWGSIVIEVAAGISLILNYRLKRIILFAAISLHLFIALIIGLWSFSIIMWGCLTFLLIPFGRQIISSSREVQQREVPNVKLVLTAEQAMGHAGQS
jgi:antimicrobial peptide system SdpB family protein